MLEVRVMSTLKEIVANTKHNSGFLTATDILFLYMFAP